MRSIDTRNYLISAQPSAYIYLLPPNLHTAQDGSTSLPHARPNTASSAFPSSDFSRRLMSKSNPVPNSNWAPISSRLVLPKYSVFAQGVLRTGTQYRETEPEPPCASCPAVGHLRKASKASDSLPSGAQRRSPTRYCQVGQPAQPVPLRIGRSPDLLPSYCVMEWKQTLRTTTDTREFLSRHG